MAIQIKTSFFCSKTFVNLAKPIVLSNCDILVSVTDCDCLACGGVLGQEH